MKPGRDARRPANAPTGPLSVGRRDQGRSTNWLSRRETPGPALDHRRETACPTAPAGDQLALADRVHHLPRAGTGPLTNWLTNDRPVSALKNGRPTGPAPGSLDRSPTGMASLETAGFDTRLPAPTSTDPPLPRLARPVTNWLRGPTLSSICLPIWSSLLSLPPNLSPDRPSPRPTGRVSPPPARPVLPAGPPPPLCVFDKVPRHPRPVDQLVFHNSPITAPRSDRFPSPRAEDFISFPPRPTHPSSRPTGPLALCLGSFSRRF